MTTVSEILKLEQLVHTFAPNSKLLGVWNLKGGISADMAALEIEDRDGQRRKWIVRRPADGTLQRHPHAARDEFRLLQIARSMGLATPTPYHLDRSGEIFSTPYLVIDYIEGEIEFAPADLAGCMRQMAAHLAQIHSIDGANQDLAFLSVKQGKCVEMCRERAADINVSLDEEHIRAALASIWPVPQQNAPTLLHGDYWPGNILWRDGKLVAVIDWEDAALGDPLIDLAISRLDIAWIFGIEAMLTFTDHYQSLTNIDYTNLAYWDLCAALRLIRLAGADLENWVAFFPPFGRPDITVQTLKADYNHFITQALARLVG